MAKSEFLKVLSDILYPTLRKEGFRGSGATLRRIREPLIHVVNIQGSSNAKGCYVNLGAHLDFLDTVGDRELVDIREADCAFRTRLEPPDRSLLGRWQYGSSELEAADTAKSIAEVWAAEGRIFFSRYATYPESFHEAVASADVDSLHPHELLTYARISQHLGLRDRALEFIEEALPNVAPMATGLRSNLKRLHRQITST